MLPPRQRLRSDRRIPARLRTCHADIDVYDPWVSKEEAHHEYGIDPIDQPAKGVYDAVVLAVAHKQFADEGAEGIHAYGKSQHVLCDLKYVLPPEASDMRL